MVPKIWLKNRLSHIELGRAVTESDYDLLATGDCDIYKPNGDRLLCFRKNILSPQSKAAALPVLRSLKNQLSDRSIAGGVKSARKIKKDGTVSRFSRPTASVPSIILGYFNRVPKVPYCRKTAFNAARAKDFESLSLMMKELAGCFAETVPERYSIQKAIAENTTSDFVIENTPWTTLTINNNWQTYTHTDKGDLNEGFSCLTVLRNGSYRGGVLVFPAFRVGVDLHDGDMVMMDAHEVHGNTAFTDTSEDYERISVVLYYRTKMQECGSAAEELQRAKELRGALTPDVDADVSAEDASE